MHRDQLLNDSNLVTQPNYFLTVENFDEEEFDFQLEQVTCIKRSIFKTIVSIFLSIFIIPLIFVYCNTSFKVLLLFSKCDPKNASHLLLLSKSKAREIQKIRYFLNLSAKPPDKQYFFIYNYNKYLINFKTNKVIPCNFQIKKSFTSIHDYSSNYLDDEERNVRHNLYGNCVIEIPEKSYSKIFFDTIFGPFYLFQMFSIIIWIFQAYYLHSIIFFFISVFLITMELLKIKDNHRRLHKIAYYECKIKAMRINQKNKINFFEEISSINLIPGDVIEIPEKGEMSCDCIILNGACIVNEETVTGKSIQVLKYALPNSNDIFDLDSHKKHIIFSGTKMIRHKPPKGQIICGLVIRTGYLSKQGQIMKCLLNSKLLDLKYEMEPLHFYLDMIIVIILLENLIQFVFNASEFFEQFKDIINILDLGLQLALPAVLIIWIFFTIKNKNKFHLFNILLETMNASKIIDLFLNKIETFDEQNLKFFGYKPVIENNNCIEFKQIILKNKIPIEENINNKMHPIIKCMACCHSLSNLNNNLIGDPLELEIFQSIKWNLEESDYSEDNIIMGLVSSPLKIKNGILRKQHQQKIQILRRFDFSPDLQKISVIVKEFESGKFFVYTKSSPEKIKELCHSVPSNFDKELSDLYSKGYKVICFGGREINLNYKQSQKVRREFIETKLHFYGYAVFENKLKVNDTEIIINNLHESNNIQTIMITSDESLNEIKLSKDLGNISCDPLVYLRDITFQKFVSENITSSFHYFLNKLTKKEKVSKKNKDYEINKISIQKRTSTSKAYFHNIEFDRSNELLIINSNTRPSFFLTNFNSCNTEKNEIINHNEIYLKNFPYNDIIIKRKTFQIINSNYSFFTQTFSLEILNKYNFLSIMNSSSKVNPVILFHDSSNNFEIYGESANNYTVLREADFNISKYEKELTIAALLRYQKPYTSCFEILVKVRKALWESSFKWIKFMHNHFVILFILIFSIYAKGFNYSDLHLGLINFILMIYLVITINWPKSSSRLYKIVPLGIPTFLQISILFCSQTLFNIVFQILIFAFFEGQFKFIPLVNKRKSFINSRPITSYNIFSGLFFFIIHISIKISQTIMQYLYKNLFLSLNFILRMGIVFFSFMIKYGKNFWVVIIMKVLLWPDQDIYFHLILKIFSFFILYTAFIYVFEYIATCLQFKMKSRKKP